MFKPSNSTNYNDDMDLETPEVPHVVSRKRKIPPCSTEQLYEQTMAEAYVSDEEKQEMSYFQAWIRTLGREELEEEACYLFEKVLSEKYESDDDYIPPDVLDGDSTFQHVNV